jgi:O-antigen ligase
VRLGALPLRTAIVLSLGILISGMFAESRGAAILEIVSFSALLAVLVMATDELTAEWGRAEVLAKSIGVTGGLAGALAIVETLGLLPGRFPLTGSFFRAAGGFGWPNELGMFLALSIPFSVHAWRIAPPGMARGAATVLLAFTAAGLIATFSRGSWVAVLLAPGALLFTGQGRFVIRFWVAALLAGALFDVVSGGLVSGRVAAALTDPSAIQRLALMAAGVLMFIGSPLIGVGPGGFGHALERVGPEVIALFDFVGSAHNSYIHMAAETGVLGLVPFVAFLGAVFLVALRGARAGRTAEGVTPAEADLRRTILWAFTTALLICMFEWTLVQGVGQLIMIIAAMAAAAPELRGTRA